MKTTRIGSDRWRFQSRRVLDRMPDGSELPRVLLMAKTADVRVWCFPDGMWHFVSDSGRVDFMTDDINTVDVKRFWQ